MGRFHVRHRRRDSRDSRIGTVEDALAHWEQFMRHPRAVVSRFPPVTTHEVLEIMPSIDGYGGLLSLPEISYDDRARAADAQVTLFAECFAHGPFSGPGFMWWERLNGARWNDGPVVSQDRAICDHMLAVLQAVFDIGTEACQLSALHGVNEFAGDTTVGDAASAVRRLTEGRVLSVSVREYASRVAAGNGRR